MNLKMIKFNILAALVLLLSLFMLKAAAQEDKESQSYEKAGIYKVNVLDFPDLKDAKRNDRPVPLAVYYPEDDGCFPLVIMSHGAMGNRESMIYQAQHVASHGYVVICPEHVCSNVQRMKYYRSRAGGSKGLGEILQIMMRDPESVLQRPKDISFAIDQAILWNKQHQVFKAKINAQKVAVMGHSYGAYTTLVVCGAQPILDHLEPPVPPGKGLASGLGDSRVIFGLAMSPQGAESVHFSDESYKTIDRPLVCFSGTKDTQQGLEGNAMPAENRLEIFKSFPPGEKYFIWLENATHLSFSDNKATRLLPSKLREDIQRICKAIMVVSCDYYLKGDEKAKGFLTKQYVDSLLGDVVNKVTWFEK